MTTIHGIKNCDTMKRAFAWLDDRGIAYTFHDYRKLGIDAATLSAWSKQAGWEKLLNTQGTTWRKLSEADRANMDKDKAIALMVAHPSLIKRPVIVHGEELVVGFDAGRMSKLFGC